MPSTVQYGAWESPITSDLIVAKSIGLGQIVIDGQTIYWAEMHPGEGGRNTIVRRLPDGKIEELLPPPWNARTRVHEYGGNRYLVHNGVIFFSNFADQRLYRMAPSEEPRPLTPPIDLRYADGVVDSQRGRIICIREDHVTSDREAVNTIVGLRMEGGDLETGGQVLISGADFYSTPRISPDGQRLLWLQWNHPNMPWDGTELWAAEIGADGGLRNAARLAGGQNESIFQPEWSPEGEVYFVSDRTGWWNLYRWRDDQAVNLRPMQAEFGEPAWVFGVTTYGFESAERILCSYIQNGEQRLASLNPQNLAFSDLVTPYTEHNLIHAMPGHVVFYGASATTPYTLVQMNLATGALLEIRRSVELQVDPGYLSKPQPIEFPTENGLTAYAYYYPPTNKDYVAPEGELPPLIVESHGGPTGATSAGFDLEKQYWTSRGFGLVDVNYGGSTGYGRAYRERLKGQWGIVDVDDCANAARFLASTGRADPKRLAIHGGSAGGYTTLAALTFRKVFQAGASHFGISDAETLATDTHKFESRYLDGLIGPYPAAREVYIARSPIHFTDQLECALILFQGAEDKVVPPDQARTMFEAVRRRGLPTAYLEFAGEQHGFRRAENIKRSLDGELYFYGQVFGFRPADEIEPVEIHNLLAN